MGINAMFWLLLMIIMIIVEIITLGLTTIWFAGGALVACILAVAGFGRLVQMFAFIIVSAVLILFTRPLFKKRFDNMVQKTNTDSMVGIRVKITEKVDNINNTGKLSYNGVEWIARSQEDSITIEAGSIVTVTAISGNKMIVKQE